MPSGFVSRAFESPLTAGPSFGVIISATGKFIMACGTGTTSRRVFMWDAVNQIYKSIAFGISFNGGTYSPDEAWFVGIDSSGTMRVMSVDPVTGAHTEVANKTGMSFGRQVEFFQPGNIIVVSGNGSNRYVAVLTWSGSVITEQTNTGSSFAPNASICTLRGPTNYTFFRITEPGTVQLITINPTTYAATITASLTNAFGIGLIRTATTNKLRNLIAMAPGGNNATTDPWLRVIKYDPVGGFSTIPAGGTALTNYPRDDLKPANKVTPGFVSDDNALFNWGIETGNLSEFVKSNDAGTEWTALDPALLPSDIPAISGVLSRADSVMDNSLDGKVTAFASLNAPYLVAIQLAIPTAAFTPVGIMGTAAAEAKVDINATLAGTGPMGDAALTSTVATNASFDDIGFLGTAAVTAGVDDSGPDTQLIYIRPAVMLLDSSNLTYSEVFAGLSAFLNETGHMGLADIRAGVGVYSIFDQLGIMGSADLETTYIQVSAELTATGLMGSAAINADVPIGVYVQAQGVMGTAEFIVNAPLGVFLDATGPMGLADLIAYDPQEWQLAATGVMGSATVLAVSQHAIVLDATGLLGVADIRAEWIEAALEPIGLMGDAEITTFRSGELANIDAQGILGQADIELNEILPIDGAIQVIGPMGDAELIVAVPHHAVLMATGIMGDAAGSILTGELARFEPIGIMGSAEFLNLPGLRGDIRAQGLMGLAALEAEVNTLAQLEAIGIMGRAEIETRRRVRRKTFFIVKPF